MGAVMQRKLLFGALLLSLALLVLSGWSALTSSPRMPVIGMTQQEVGEMLGVESALFVPDLRMLECDTATGVVMVQFDADGRVNLVQFQENESTVWERLLGRMAFWK